MNSTTDPTDEYDNGKYLTKNPTWHTEDSPYKASFVIDAIDRNNLSPKRSADIGCGAGLVTEILAKRYPASSFVGYELSANARIFWSQRQKLPNLSYASDNLLELRDQFDLIVCLDVFEHVEDYFGFLRALRCKGKNFIFNIPLDMNVMKLMTSGIKYAREEVGHLHYFSQYSAIKTLEDCGYKISDQKLSVAFLSTPPRNIRQVLVLPIRLLSLVLGKSFATRVFGGISLVVFATAD